MERQTIETSYPLTPMQQGMLFHHLSTPQSGVDIEQIVCDLEEPLVVAIFEQAWAHVAGLHAALRTALRWEGVAEPVQDVHAQVRIPFESQDWRSRDAAEQARSLAAWLESDRARGFDLASPPLTRVALFRRGDASWTCVWSLHHALMDGRSFRIVLDDVFACYDALQRGEAWTRSQPRAFREHVAWLRDRDRSGDAAFWRERLHGVEAPTPWPPQRSASHGDSVETGTGSETRQLDAATTERLRAFATAHGLGLDTLVQGAWALLLARMAGHADVVFGTTHAGRRSAGPGADSTVGLLINTILVRASVDPDAALVPWLQHFEAAQRALGEFEHTPLPDIQRWSDVAAGTPLFESLVLYDHRSLGTALRARGERFAQRAFQLVERTPYPVTLYAYGEDELRFELSHARERLGAIAARRLLDRLETLLTSFVAQPEARLGDLPMLAAAERRQLLVEWNDTARTITEDCVHRMIEAQAARTPDAIAVFAGNSELRHRDLDARANRLAHRLRSLGVAPDVRVGVATDRSPDLLVAMLGVLKAGGAYVPLDPSYPRERLAQMIEDAGIAALVTQSGVLAHLPATAAPVICLDRDAALLERESSEAPAVDVRPEHLAYVIYTSGSTGRPKGVMVEHRQVANFFAGMDEEIGREPGVWLAVTSLSFDISVLELLWTLSRGYQVVLHAGEGARSVRAATAQPERPMLFSLFYFASHEGGEQARDKYRLILESAKFADRHGFSAVWTPERHFHAFGGLSPNPSVTAAALAIATERVRIRSGSVVLPLHHPVRVAEEWALVDNLSDGRVDLGVAQGWFPNDFVLGPDRYENRRKLFHESLETIRKLWRGEAISLPNPMGDVVEVRTMPRPVQPELPIFITAAKNPETFRQAGEMGAHVLTHLLGQSVDEVAEKIAIYRAAWQQAGHPGAGTVTLMLHTFVGESDEEVHELVRGPMKSYLGSSVDLAKDYVASLPLFRDDPDVDPNDLSPEEVDNVLEYSFERYFRTAGLFGTPATCLHLVDRLKAIGVDELACLIDFGVDGARVLGALDRLDEVRRLANPTGCDAAENHSFADTVQRRGVTHLQCTPSMASMLLADDEARHALGSLQTLLLGGEALPAALARQIRETTPARLLNMYGPTETTIWSSVHRVEETGEAIPIGHPIANTELYVLDAQRALAPVGAIGELYIGGRGVVRGYLDRPDLTTERFVPHPWRAGERLYRTGDLARHREDGTLEFLGRADHQVKIRGHRIELGEIESRLREHPAIRECVVVAREFAPGDQRIVAYVVARTGQSLSPDELLAGLRRHLPEFMVPARIVALERMPQTPNGKIDRGALPAEAPVAPPPAETSHAPTTGLERRIAEIWSEVLGVARVGSDANFFDLGGHSLLAVRVQSRLEACVGRRLPIADLFRFPTVRALAEYVTEGESGGSREQTQDRAELRQKALAQRRGLRSGRRDRGDDGATS